MNVGFEGVTFVSEWAEAVLCRFLVDVSEILKCVQKEKKQSVGKHQWWHHKSVENIELKIHRI